jgi:hypothetical protein
MALIATIGGSDSNSYNTLAAVDAYHLSRGHATWTGTDADKEAAIIRATFGIDNLYRRGFDGKKATGTQSLEWPRSSAVDTSGYAIAVDVLPNALLFGSSEAALIELVTPGALSPEYIAGIIKTREKVDVVEEETEYSSGSTGRTSYAIVEQYINALLSSGRYQMKMSRG